MVSRRRLLSYFGIGGAASIAGGFRNAAAQHNDPMPGMDMSGQVHQPLHGGIAHSDVARTGHGFVPVQTPNGRSLPWKWVNGVKEFHLIAEEFEHEFAPGCKAKCWGYNGSTPGPTIEAVEGDRVRILVTNHLRSRPRSTGTA